MARRTSKPLPEFTPHAATTPPENPDLLDQLSFEHRRLQTLWSQLQLAHRRHVVERPGSKVGLPGQRVLGEQILRILAEHEALELDLLYPVAARVVGEDWAGHARDDHADVSDLLGEVVGEDPEDEGVFEIFTDVLTRMMTHIDEEENVIFPMIRTAVPSSELALRGPTHRPEPAPPPDVIDLAAAERETATDAAGGGASGEDDPAGHDGNGGRGRGRLRLRRR